MKILLRISVFDMEIIPNSIMIDSLTLLTYLNRDIVYVEQDYYLRF